jgi:pimeloyl-ACP methyl ester carboxylesterase
MYATSDRKGSKRSPPIGSPSWCTVRPIRATRSISGSLANPGWIIWQSGVSTSMPSICPAMAVRHAPQSWSLRTADAVKALGTVVDFVGKRRGVERIDLIGWSWGTAITATYAAENPSKVERLALYAPVWIRTTPSLVQVEGKLGAYRVVSREAAEKRRRAGLSEDKALELMPKAWFDAWADATFATDPNGAGETVRAPNGVVLDGKEY